MSEAPERIYVSDLTGQSYPEDPGEGYGCRKYIRADLHEALERRVEELEADHDRLMSEQLAERDIAVGELRTRIAALEAEKAELRNDNANLVDTIDAMLRAAGWDGTLETLNAAGSKPSHFIRAAMQAEKAELRKDKERLDWLEGKATGYGGGWIARLSTTGRGFRLHESEATGAEHPNPRTAIDAAMQADGEEG